MAHGQVPEAAGGGHDRGGRVRHKRATHRNRRRPRVNPTVVLANVPCSSTVLSEGERFANERSAFKPLAVLGSQ